MKFQYHLLWMRSDQISNQTTAFVFPCLLIEFPIAYFQLFNRSIFAFVDEHLERFVNFCQCMSKIVHPLFFSFLCKIISPLPFRLHSFEIIICFLFFPTGFRMEIFYHQIGLKKISEKVSGIKIFPLANSIANQINVFFLFFYLQTFCLVDNLLNKNLIIERIIMCLRYFCYLTRVTNFYMVDLLGM